MSIEFVNTLLNTLRDMRTSPAESVRDSFNVAFVLAVILSLFIGIQSGCNRLPFPVSIRQRAWLPMFAFALIWAAGGLAIIVALLLLSRGPNEFYSSIASVAARVPLSLLAYLVMLRIWWANPHLVLCVFFAFIFLVQDNPSWFQNALLFYPIWWPLTLLVIAYYIWEAPLHLARYDRLLVGQARSPSPLPMRELHISSRRAPVLWLGDVMEGGLLLVTMLLYINFFLPMYLSGRVLDPSSFMMWILPIVMGFSLIMVIRGLYQQAQASGFGPTSAVTLVLMQMTVILIPVAQALGVKKGIVARCGRCHLLKFLWSPACLHCDNPGPGTIANKKLASHAQGKSYYTSWPTRFAARLGVALWFLLILGPMGNVGSRPFVAHGVSLVFHQGSDPQIQEKALNHVKAWVETNPSLQEGSVRSPDLQGGFQGIPEKFRINVTVFNPGSLWMEGLGLRWDPAVTLTERIAQDLAHELKDICPVHIVHNERPSYAGSPLFQTRSHLDNQIHWKEP